MAGENLWKAGGKIVQFLPKKKKQQQNFKKKEKINAYSLTTVSQSFLPQVFISMGGKSIMWFLPYGL